MTDKQSDYDILRHALLTIRKIIRNSNLDYEANEFYNIAVDALDATKTAKEQHNG